MAKFLFLGCGKMGSAIVKNLIEAGDVEPNQISILKPSSTQILGFDLNYLRHLSELKEYVEVVFIAIKPQKADEILADFFTQGLALGIFDQSTIFISILAGKKISYFEKLNQKRKLKLIRTMPNLAIAYSEGIFGYLPNRQVTQNDLNKLTPFFDNFGFSFRLENEKQFELITTIFGSGPAYIFLLAKIFLEIATKGGIKSDIADKLVKKLLTGSALLAQNSSADFDGLISLVASKGGTTEEALKVLNKNQALERLFKLALAKSAKRAKELAR